MISGSTDFISYSEMRKPFKVKREKLSVEIYKDLVNEPLNSRNDYENVLNNQVNNNINSDDMMKEFMNKIKRK